MPSEGPNPWPETAYFLSMVHVSHGVIFPSVSVPVLSVQMIEAEPNVSTAANSRTRTLTLMVMVSLTLAGKKELVERISLKVLTWMKSLRVRRAMMFYLGVKAMTS